jgi:hypothetical protein
MSYLPTVVGCKREAGRRSRKPCRQHIVQEPWPRRVQFRQYGAGKISLMHVRGMHVGSIWWGIVFDFVASNDVMACRRLRAYTMSWAT